MTIAESLVGNAARPPGFFSSVRDSLTRSLASMIMVTVCTPILAQTTSGGQSVAAAEASGGDQLSEVTVTAERFAENDLRTPIAITVLSGAQLAEANVVSTTDLKGLVPSLNIITQGGGGAGSFGANEMAIYIRGVGSAARFFNNDPGVGIYLNDIYLSSSQNLNLSFYDLQNIQVLNGPQGTLFGRNTIGGALLLQTALPGQEFGGYAQASIGSFGRLDTQGALNLPFSDILTSRLSFFTSNVNGYITHALNDQTNDDINEKSVRYQVHFQPSSSFSADLLGEYGESHDNGNEEITVRCNPNAHYVKDYDLTHTIPYCTQYAPLGQPYEVYGNVVASFPTPAGSGLNQPGGFLPYDRGKSGTLGLHLTYEVNDELTVKSITSLRRSDLNSYRDDGTPAGLYTELDDYWDREYSEELQGLAKLWGGRLNLVGGLYYFHDNAASIQDTGPDYDDPVGYFYGNTVEEKSLAAYLQGTLALTEKLSFIAGIRYTHDEKASSSNVWEGCYGSYLEEYQTGTGGCWIPGPTKNDYASASGIWTHTDPRFQLQYQWTPDIMSYVTATSGYLSGGFNAQLPYFPPPPYNLPFQQETVWNYEFGTKGEWLEHRLRAKFDVFDQIFDNLQSGVLQYYNGIDVTTTTSAADGHERGYEIEIDAIPIENLTVVATYSRLGQGYDAIFPQALAAGLSKSAAITGAPLSQGSLIGNYTYKLPNGATIVPSVNWRYVGHQWSGTYPLQYLAPDYALLGAHLTYTDASNKWSVALWGNNLADKYYYATYANPAVLNKNIGLQQVTPGRPREVGATFRYNF